MLKMIKEFLIGVYLSCGVYNTDQVIVIYLRQRVIKIQFLQRYLAFLQLQMFILCLRVRFIDIFQLREMQTDTEKVFARRDINCKQRIKDKNFCFLNDRSSVCLSVCFKGHQRLFFFLSVCVFACSFASSASVYTIRQTNIRPAMTLRSMKETLTTL